MAFWRSTTAVQEEATRIGALLNNGYIRIYDGTPPASADASLSGNNLLAELRYAATAFGAPDSTGLATANSISSVNASATGTAAFFRSLESNGTTVIMQGAVGTSSAEMIINSTSISSGASVSITSHTYQAVK